MAHFTCEVVYRGIFQKNLAARICRGIVLSSLIIEAIVAGLLASPDAELATPLPPLETFRAEPVVFGGDAAFRAQRVVNVANKCWRVHSPDTTKILTQRFTTFSHRHSHHIVNRSLLVRPVTRNRFSLAGNNLDGCPTVAIRLLIRKVVRHQ